MPLQILAAKGFFLQLVPPFAGAALLLGAAGGEQSRCCSLRWGAKTLASPGTGDIRAALLSLFARGDVSLAAGREGGWSIPLLPGKEIRWGHRKLHNAAPSRQGSKHRGGARQPPE